MKRTNKISKPQAKPPVKKPDLKQSMATLRRVMHYLRRYWLLFLLSLLFSAITVTGAPL